MKALIVEDESPAAERLIRLLTEVEPQIQIAGKVVSIKSAVTWLRENESPDIIFMDVHLADGNSFEIFRETKVQSPVIFTTAYDQYALDAFKVNSIDYLLKPVKKDELERAINKLQQNREINIQQVAEMIRQLAEPKSFQRRIIIRYGDTIKMVEIADVAYFYTEDKINYLCSKDNLRYPVDQNLDELEAILDPKTFFRINRQFIVNVSAIDKMLAWSKSRVKIVLKPASDQETIVSTERSPFFKEWLTGSPS